MKFGRMTSEEFFAGIKPAELPDHYLLTFSEELRESNGTTWIAIENDRSTERRIETIMKLVGPFSILLLGGFILLIAMGVIVPLFSIQASIGGGL